MKKYKRYLNKKDPIDKKIIELVKNKELSIGLTKMKIIDELDEIKKELDQFTGTENYYKHLTGLKYTDGIKYLADKTNCYWFIDIIASYQHTRPHLFGRKQFRDVPFQIWKLKVFKDHTAIVQMMEDTNAPILVSQELEYTDFPLGKINVYCIDGVILLKSEY